MHVLVETSDCENLLVVLDRLSAEEFFGLLETAVFHAGNRIRLSVQAVAIRNPAVVTAENDDFSVVQSKRAQSVTRRPGVVLVDKRHWFPLLLLQLHVAIKALD